MMRICTVTPCTPASPFCLRPSSSASIQTTPPTEAGFSAPTFTPESVSPMCNSPRPIVTAASSVRRASESAPPTV